MKRFDFTQYQANKIIRLENRQWPDRQITKAPTWCSVDLRDGNQALINPMSIAQKHQLFDCLIAMGFKQIEVGFPAASQTDFDFIREIIEHDRIPADVSIQVLTQARDALIERTFEALKGAKKAIVHVYNSTSVIQREQVFKLDKSGIVDIAIQGATKVQQQARLYPQTQWQFQYSPESFTQTETDFAVDVCNAVMNIWSDTAQPVIINLPATVEVNSPNMYADQVEYFCRHINHRDKIIVSLHTHNDRGCGIAAAELGLLAGADRIEGTLLGNGERTGNMDIITMAMNFYSQGIDPELDMSNMQKIVDTVYACTDIKVHPRHPYAGELVFTAFSGSHQDAINKCLTNQQHKTQWEVAYLPINPEDIGRSYEEVIRINSQSGKGGSAYIIKEALGIDMPRWMQVEFSTIVQAESEASGAEVSSEMLQRLFKKSYIPHDNAYTLINYKTNREHGLQKLTVSIENNGINAPLTHQLHGEGHGVMEAFSDCLTRFASIEISIEDYQESAATASNHAEAHCFIKAHINGNSYGGFGQSQDIIEASLLALLSAFNAFQQHTKITSTA